MVVVWSEVTNLGPKDFSHSDPCSEDLPAPTRAQALLIGAAAADPPTPVARPSRSKPSDPPL